MTRNAIAVPVTASTATAPLFSRRRMLGLLGALGAGGVVAGGLRDLWQQPARAATSAAPDINQQGLTGAWYDVSTEGQGFFIEIYPDLLGAGQGFLFGGWYTYDVVAGGAESQRWYTFSGALNAGGDSATVSIHQNTAGNFAAAPTTVATPVGSALIRFDSCTHAQFTFSLTDGRAGDLSLTRLLPNIACATPDTTVAADADFPFSGSWYNPDTSGQGVMIEINPTLGAAVMAWYTYAANGATSSGNSLRWFTSQAPYTAGARTLSLTVYETVGGVFNQASTTTTTAVGTATVTFTGCESAVLSYQFTGGALSGRSGSIALSRAGYAPSACSFGGSCALIPSETAGPYPLSSVLSTTGIIRRDITEGRAGVPLRVVLKLVNVNNRCAPVSNAAVYLWHCDKDGVYSGYANQTGGVNATGQIFMRGVQVADTTGQVIFDTIYPGWYNGRITHIHFQVYLNNALGGQATATSQIAFPPAITTAVYASSLYSGRGQNTSVTSFAADNIFADGTAYQLATVTGSVTSGYVATLTVGIAA